MSGKKPLTYPCELIYRYDGSLAGFYSCVHASVYSGQMPIDIQAEEEAQQQLLTGRWIETSPDNARKVRAAVGMKLGFRAQELVETVFLSCLPKREIKMLRYLLLGFEEGQQAIAALTHPAVASLLRAERHLLSERHLLTGFIRFADYDGRLVATIRPKNFVLPFLADHFIDRYSNENFLIYDRTHEAALIYENKRSQIVQVTDIQAAFVPSREEERYQALWKQFYRTIAIEARYNPKCRMTHMPKRYWAEMTEMKELLEE